MASNNKRREATRRQLEAQLQERQRREAARKRAVLIGSIVGTVLVIGLVIGLLIGLNVVGGGSGSKHKTRAAAQPPTSTPAPSTSATSKPCTVTHPKGSVVFDKVTIANPTNLAKDPDPSSCSKQAPTSLEFKDLVTGKGAKATPTSMVSVQYAGVLYSDGTTFDSSWAKGGQPVPFSLTGVVKGFTLGIGGSGSKIPPMRVGGRRVLILPSSYGYGPQANGAIPANSPLVFVVDLKSVK